jgi:DNA primase
MIPDEYIETIRKHLSILDVVKYHCDLKRTGSNWISSCPFPNHSDNDPSFSVHPAKGIYKCFGCGEGGNMFTFIMAMEDCSFPEAVKFCAEIAGLDFPYSTESSNFNDQILALLKEASRNYYLTLQTNSDKLNYLTEKRHISRDTIEKYGLGFCSGTYIALATNIYDDSIINASGIFYDYNLQWKESLQDRFIFPITTFNGKIIAFGGRRTPNSKHPAKYKNSSESTVYDKSSILFGLYQAKPSIKKMGYTILTEGYTDVLRMAENGYPNTLAICGTAFTLNHGKLLRRITNRVIIYLDNDEAGNKAIDSTYAQLFDAGIDHIYIAFCKTGQDPDSYFREDPIEATKSIQTSKPFLDYRIPSNMDSNQREQCLLDIKTIATDITNTQRKRLYTSFCSTRLGIREEVLWTEKQKHTLTTSGKQIYDNIEILTLAALLNTKEIMPNELTQLNSIKFSDEDLTFTFDRILNIYHNTDDENRSRRIELLYDNLTPKQADILSSVIILTDSNIQLSTILHRLTEKDKKKRIKYLKEQIRKREQTGQNILHLEQELDLWIAE